MADLTKFTGALASTAIKKVTIRSQFSGEQEVQPFAPNDQPPPPPGGFSIMSLIKPEIQLDTAMGPYIIAPYGHPTENYLPYLIGGAALLGFGIVATIAFIARRI